jgi:hypothetical protein
MKSLRDVTLSKHDLSVRASEKRITKEIIILYLNPLITETVYVPDEFYFTCFRYMYGFIVLEEHDFLCCIRVLNLRTEVGYGSVIKTCQSRSICYAQVR